MGCVDIVYYFLHGRGPLYERKYVEPYTSLIARYQ